MYYNAWRFFKKRELQGVKNTAPKKAKTAATTATTKTVAPEASPAVSATTGSLGPATPYSERSNPLGTPANANKAHTDASVGHLGDIPDASISPAVQERVDAVQPGLREALKSAELAPKSAEEASARIEREEAKTGNVNVSAGPPAGLEAEGGVKEVAETDASLQTTGGLRPDGGVEAVGPAAEA